MCAKHELVVRNSLFGKNDVYIYVDEYLGKINWEVIVKYEV